MIEREITDYLRESIKKVPAVALLGPRQVGKTTLARHLANEWDSHYLDLESPEDLLKMDDPIAYFSRYGNKLIVLDEIQRVPDLFKTLRGIIDSYRQQGKKGEQFLLLGSASMDLMRQSAESLAGRIRYIELSGLNALEVQNEDSKNLDRLWLRGGFPESYLADSDRDSMEWLEMLIRTYLERDVPQMGFRIPASRLRRLWTMLAHLQGENINYSKIGTNLEADGKTVSSYLDILIDLLLVRRLNPWHENVKKRLVKSPRFYIRDSGITHRLLGIHTFEDLLGHPVLGKSWESFVIENILSILPDWIEPYYFRTSAGAEIDLILKFSQKEIWAIEIKHGTAPKISQGFHLASEDIQASRKYVIYGGDDEFPIQRNTTIISLVKFMNTIKNKVSI